MSNLISRQAAIDAVHKNYDTILDFKSDGCTIASSFEDIINDLPSAEPEHKKGKWKSDKKITPVYDSLFDIEDGYFCSECGKFTRTISNYCPHCGADMRGEEDE